MFLKILKRMICVIVDHKGISDDTWGGYGWTCSRCGKNDFSIHDM